MFWDTHDSCLAQKNEPTYNFGPHYNPPKCSLGALAMMLHFVFDEKQLISRVPGWDWADTLSWRKVRMHPCPCLAGRSHHSRVWRPPAYRGAGKRVTA
jgi:hypothetical protein